MRRVFPILAHLSEIISCYKKCEEHFVWVSHLKDKSKLEKYKQSWLKQDNAGFLSCDRDNQTIQQIVQ